MALRTFAVGTEEFVVRRPNEIERAYLDFDGFFASVEQLVNPALRGRPVGVVPFAGSEHTCIIACSREAKEQGVKNVMPVRKAKEQCPDLVLVSQSPDLYRRAHNALLSEISAVLPVDAVKSIDEITLRIEPCCRKEPDVISRKIKARITQNIGPSITCSIGFAANRHLAKMACKAGKKRNQGTYGNGHEVWKPEDMPGPILSSSLRDVPGIGARMERRLIAAGVRSINDVLGLAPKHMRKLWGGVNGERLWYALHGYDIQTQPLQRGMYGHGRVLPPGHRTASHAHAASRLLLVKAARRMRRDGWNAGGLWLWLECRRGSFSNSEWLPAVRDDQAVLSALEIIWSRISDAMARDQIIRLGVTLWNLTPAAERQFDFLTGDAAIRQKWEDITVAIDTLNQHHCRTLVRLGEWNPPGEYAGGKISYTRIPSMEDFW